MKSLIPLIICRVRSRRLLGGARRRAKATFQARSEVLGPARLRRHPRPYLPRRLVAHVLRMPTLEVGDPGAIGILMKSHNPSLHQPPNETRLSGAADK